MLQQPLHSAAADPAVGEFAQPGLSIGAVASGSIAYAIDLGFDRLEAARRTTPQTVYNIASVSKQFTAACILLLARSGVLHVDDPVARYLPNLPHAQKITLRHLLTHTSGYVDYYPLGFPDEDKLADATPEAIVQRYAALPLQFEPGSTWSYSNTGFHILGRIIEVVSGEAFGPFLEQNVLRRAGMRSSSFNDPSRITEAHAFGYSRFALGPIRRAQSEREGWLYSSGGIASTTHDLMAWYRALMDERVLDGAELALMTRRQVIGGDPGPSAMGWFVETHDDRTILLHSGGLSGFASQVIVDPHSRDAIVVLANADHVPVGSIARNLFGTLTGKPIPLPPAPIPTQDDDLAFLEEWTKRFASGDVDRNRITNSLRVHVTEERLADAREGIGALGPLHGARPIAGGERGGMSWLRARAQFREGEADVVIRRTIDGDLAEFNVFPVS